MENFYIEKWCSNFDLISKKAVALHSMYSNEQVSFRFMVIAFTLNNLCIYLVRYPINIYIIVNILQC